MVNLTRIYTRTGDGGRTRLGDMSETSKIDPRLEAYATVDETNAQIGIVLATTSVEPSVTKVLLHIQNDLFDVGADLATPVVPNPEYPQLRIEQYYIDKLEGWSMSTTRSCRSCVRSSSTEAPRRPLNYTWLGSSREEQSGPRGLLMLSMLKR